MMGRILGLGTAAREVGEAVTGVAEVFAGNRAERDAADQERFVKSLTQFGEEFRNGGTTWFDGAVDGLNRLPRPLMAIGTIGLFSYAMADPAGFATRMQGLAFVPEPLWWLLGAVVSFYFGARELHHYRHRQVALPPAPEPVAGRAGLFGRRPAPKRTAAAPVPAAPIGTVDPDGNAAVAEWRASH